MTAIATKKLRFVVLRETYGRVDSAVLGWKGLFFLLHTTLFSQPATFARALIWVLLTQYLARAARLIVTGFFHSPLLQYRMCQEDAYRRHFSCTSSALLTLQTNLHILLPSSKKLKILCTVSVLKRSEPALKRSKFI